MFIYDVKNTMVEIWLGLRKRVLGFVKVQRIINSTQVGWTLGFQLVLFLSGQWSCSWDSAPRLSPGVISSR